MGHLLQDGVAFQGGAHGVQLDARAVEVGVNLRPREGLQHDRALELELVRQRGIVGAAAANDERGKAVLLTEGIDGGDATVAPVGGDFVQAVEEEQQGVVFDPGARDPGGDVILGVERGHEPVGERLFLRAPAPSALHAAPRGEVKDDGDGPGGIGLGARDGVPRQL